MIYAQVSELTGRLDFGSLTSVSNHDIFTRPRNSTVNTQVISISCKKGHSIYLGCCIYRSLDPSVSKESVLHDKQTSHKQKEIKKNWTRLYIQSLLKPNTSRNIQAT